MKISKLFGSCLLAVSALLACSPDAFAYTADEVDSHYDNGRNLAEEMRNMLRTLKVYVPNLGTHSFTFLDGVNYVAVAEEKAGLVNVEGLDYATQISIKITNVAGDPVLAVLLGRFGSYDVGEFKMGNPDAPEFILRFRLGTTISDSFVEADYSGIHIEKAGEESTRLQDAEGKVCSAHNGIVCQFPGVITELDWQNIEERVRNGEDFTTVLNADYGATCTAQ